MEKEKALHTLTQELKNTIESKVFIKNKTEQIEEIADPESWIFDFRRVLMHGKTADMLSEIFYETYKDAYPFQLCSLEIAGVPLMTSIMTKFFFKGHTDINAFFIRKSRKKSGLLRMIEGEVQKNVKIILVDDIMNRGSSFWRQIEVLESLGHRVDTVWSVIRFRDACYYERFHNRNISISSIFTLNDFTASLGRQVKNLTESETLPPKMPFSPQWIFKGEHPNYFQVKPKSQPLLHNKHIYYGCDDGTFWSISQADGSVLWKHKTGRLDKKKGIFSNPVIYNNIVIFGSHDGNVYALDAQTGKKKWVCFEADWIGSSPAVAEDLGLIFIGLQFGLIRKHGGIIALNATTGAPIWMDSSHTKYTLSSPFYIKKFSQVVIGSSDGTVRLYDAKTGTLIWKFKTFGGSFSENESCDGGILGGFIYSQKHDYVVFGSEDGFLYILDRNTGHLVYHFKCNFSIRATPFLYEDRVYFSSLDKHLRCINLQDFRLVFEINIDQTRIFAQPTVINKLLYIGTNAGRLHELDPHTGTQLGYFQANERITNTITYDKDTDTYFLPTYANEIICLKRNGI